MTPRALRWLLATCFTVGVVASCSGSDTRQSARDDSAGESGSGGAAGAPGSPSSGGKSATVGGDGAGAAMPGAAGLASEGGAASAGAPSEGGAAAGGGGTAGGAAGTASSAGAGGAGGAFSCCPAVADYSAAAQLLPTEVCAAWNLVDSINSVPSISSNALRIATTTTESDVVYYAQSDPHLIFPAVFTVEARMKLISGSSSTSSRAPASIAIVYGAGHMKNLLQMGVNEVFILDSENVRGDAITFDTTGDFHTYKIVVDTNEDTLQVFIDDVLELSGATFADPGNSPEMILFGEGSTFAQGISEWQYVKHNAYTCGD